MPPSVPLRTSPTRDQAHETTKLEKKPPPKKNTDAAPTTSNRNTSSDGATADQTATSTYNANNLNTSASSLMTGNQLGGGMYGGMYGGMNSMMYGGGGMMGSPYGYGSTTGPLSGLNQMLFSVQSVIFSLGQAVQVCLFEEKVKPLELE